MIRVSKVSLCLSVLCLFAAVAAAQQSREKIEIVKSKDYRPIVSKPSAELQSVVRKAVDDVIASYPEGSFKPDDVAVTVIDLRNPDGPLVAEVGGEQRFYSASVVKMYYMTALQQQVQDGKIEMTPEIERAQRDMIVDSSNDATQYILDVLTDTSNGPHLSPEEFTPWQYKRNRVNRYFSSMGYANINVNQKTFCEDAYGRERQSRNFPTEAAQRNMLTTNATARLIAEIALGRAVSADRSRAMMELLKRDPFADAKDANSQATEFSGKALIDRNMKGARLWSKAGWVTRERHDAAYIETPSGHKFAIAVFTQKHGSDKALIPAIVGKVIDGLGDAK